jgi:hypothetical protein
MQKSQCVELAGARWLAYRQWGCNNDHAVSLCRELLDGGRLST